MSRPATLILLILLIFLQGQLWFGRGSLPDVMRLRDVLHEQIAKNKTSLLANQRLEAELRDLRDGKEMVEERARHEIGMIRSQEIFVQYPGKL
jgi:cell division protein FtsB